MAKSFGRFRAGPDFTWIAAHAKQQALTLAGFDSMDCGTKGTDISDGQWLELNTCAAEHLAQQRPFRMLQVFVRTDTIDFTWIVGTPDGSVLLVLFTSFGLGSTALGEVQRADRFMTCDRPQVVPGYRVEVLECGEILL